MNDRNRNKRLKSWQAATYRITVEGFLEQSLSDVLGGMRIMVQKRADQSMFSVLTGCLEDQSQLMGIVNGLHELHLPILQIEIVEDEELNANND